jgi:phosphotransferase family enzyme
MVWDLEEVIDGYHLPCSWARPSQLVPYLGEAVKQVRAFSAIEQLSIDVATENWTKQHRSATKFIDWAQGQPDFDSFPLDELRALQKAFYTSSREQRNLAVVHGDWWQGNVMTRNRQVPVILDWDEVHVGEPAEMYGRHWILMCSEPRWQEEVITALGKRDDRFWLAFHAYAWMRGIDQIHYELTTFQGRRLDSYEHLTSVSPKRARFVDQMLKSLRVLSHNLGGSPPRPGQGTRRYR